MRDKNAAKKIHLGIAPIGWSNDDLPELGGHISFGQCIQEMTLAGYEGCEIGRKFPRDALQLNSILKEHQLRVASAWYSLYLTEPLRREKSITGFYEHVHFLKQLGAKVIVICECGHSIQGGTLPLFTNQVKFSETEWQQLFIDLKHLAEFAKQNEMHLVYHHHMGTGIQHEEDLERLMDETHPDELSLLLDTGHLFYAGLDPIFILKKYRHRIKHVHLKDIRKEILQQIKQHPCSFLEAVKAGIFTVPGDGCIDFQPLLEFLLSTHYEGWLIVEAEQDPDKANPLVYAKKARNYLQSILGW